MILVHFATTGDGLVAALHVLAVLVRSGKRASEACRVFAPLPQLLRNVRYAGASPLRRPISRPPSPPPPTGSGAKAAC